MWVPQPKQSGSSVPVTGKRPRCWMLSLPQSSLAGLASGTPGPREKVQIFISGYKYQKEGCRTVKGQETMDTNANTGGAVWTLRNFFFLNRVTKLWHRSPRELVQPPLLDIFKSCLALVRQFEVLGGHSRWPPEVPSNLSNSMVPYILVPTHLYCMEPSGLSLILVLPFISSAAQILQDKLLPSICPEDDIKALSARL